MRTVPTVALGAAPLAVAAAGAVLVITSPGHLWPAIQADQGDSISDGYVGSHYAFGSFLHTDRDFIVTSAKVATNEPTCAADARFVPLGSKGSIGIGVLRENMPGRGLADVLVRPTRAAAVTIVLTPAATGRCAVTALRMRIPGQKRAIVVALDLSVIVTHSSGKDPRAE